jgi:vesicular inhibitory amino acid transporter
VKKESTYQLTHLIRAVSLQSLLGALFSFGISVIFPLACYHRLYSSTMSHLDLLVNWFFLIISVILATFGTIWSFFPSPSS